jgi:hypothetical protein
MRRAILRLRWTWKKKTLEASERKEEEREEWRKNMKDLDVNKCRVIDAHGIKYCFASSLWAGSKGEKSKRIGTTQPWKACDPDF